MRIKFGKSIRLCRIITNPNDSKLLIITTDNGIYTVDMETIDNAKKFIMKYLLMDMRMYQNMNIAIVDLMG